MNKDGLLAFRDPALARQLAARPDSGVVHAMVALYADEGLREPIAGLWGVVLSLVVTADDDLDHVEISLWPTDRAYRPGCLVSLDWDGSRRISRAWWQAADGAPNPTSWDEAACFVGEALD